jgi:hypothetical protein
MAKDEPVRPNQELTPARRRLLEVAAEIEESGELSILYQHTVFCQTGLPYRNPGDLANMPLEYLKDANYSRYKLAREVREILQPGKMLSVELRRWLLVPCY